MAWWKCKGLPASLPLLGAGTPGDEELTEMLATLWSLGGKHDVDNNLVNRDEFVPFLSAEV